MKFVLRIIEPNKRKQSNMWVMTMPSGRPLMIEEFDRASEFEGNMLEITGDWSERLEKTFGGGYSCVPEISEDYLKSVISELVEL